MLVGIDASRTTVARLTGTEVYSLHLTRHLLALAGDGALFRLYFRDTPPDGLFPQTDIIEQRIIQQPRLWTHLGLRRELQRDPPHVALIPAHVVPYACPVPAVVTVHDVGYRYFPEAHTLRDRLYLDWATRYSARKAAVVLADSESTRRDLVRFYGIDSGKITVAYPGVNPALQPERDPARLAAVRQKYDLPERFILHVGTLQPRKNLSRLVEAYGQLRARLPDAPKLALVGGKGWLYDDLFAQVGRLGLAEHVLFPGHITHADLGAIYTLAEVYAFPSLFEGFGFPVVEAMRCATPVVCSDTSSLPELAGDAALTFNPEDVDALAEALFRVLSDDDLRHAMVSKGVAQAARFTWEGCAAVVWDVLQRVGQA